MNEHRRGISYMLFASLMFAAMAACVVQSKRLDPDASALTASFVRIAVNLFFILCLARFQSIRLVELLGDRSPALFLRGLFGTLSLVCAFAAIHNIGMGEASFFQSTNTFWIALVAPFFLGQRNSPFVWLAIVMGLFGLYVLYDPNIADSDNAGRLYALGSSIFSACAYLMVAKVGKKNSPISIVFYFAAVATTLHLILFAVFPVQWPKQIVEWLLLIAGGLFASVAQIYMTKAYQTAPAAVVSATAYSTPIFSMLFGMLFFSMAPSQQTMAGAIIVVGAGLLLSFSQRSDVA